MLTLSDLNVGDTVRLKLDHWHVPVFARVLGFGKQHCQLHGEFIDYTVKFQKLKASGREGSRFDLRMGTAPELLERAAPPPPQAPKSEGER